MAVKITDTSISCDACLDEDIYNKEPEQRKDHKIQPLKERFHKSQKIISTLRLLVRTDENLSKKLDLIEESDYDDDTILDILELDKDTN
jgi:hypothetical protein